MPKLDRLDEQVYNYDDFLNACCPLNIENENVGEKLLVGDDEINELRSKLEAAKAEVENKERRILKLQKKIEQQAKMVLGFYQLTQAQQSTKKPAPKTDKPLLLSGLTDKTPTVAPKLYKEREIDPTTGKQIDVMQFLEKYYGQYLTFFNSELEFDLLYQDQLGKLDKPALAGLKIYCSNRELTIRDYVKPKKVRIDIECKLIQEKGLVKKLPDREVMRFIYNQYRR